MKIMIDRETLIQTFFRERGMSERTKKGYAIPIKKYEDFTNYTINELIDIAEKEENQNIRWKNTKTREYLINYREYVYSNFSLGSAQSYFGRILTVYRHFEIEIPKLPYYSTKNSHHYAPILYDDLPDKEILKKSINIASPKIKALILFLSSSGVSRIDACDIRIKDYLNATKDYHHCDNIYDAIGEMNDKDVIPTFFLRRKKTSQDYFTFCTHEAVNAINEYLISREDELTSNSSLFDINYRYFGKSFERINNKLELGKVGAFNRLRAHMLRKYHATQLSDAGMSTEKINLIQGRKVKGIAHESYIRIKTETVKDEYIKALPYLVVSDENKFKTKLEQTEEELKIVREENKEIKNNMRKETEKIVSELLQEYLGE